MTITLDVTVGGSNANSYSSEADADTYFETKPFFSATWDALTSEQKKAYLVSASNALDRSRKEWKGTKAATTQRLEFPRGIGDSTNFPSTLIHRRVKESVYETIILLNSAGGSTGAEVSKLSAGGGLVSLEFDLNRSKDMDKRMNGGDVSTLMSLMKPWMAENRLNRV